MKHTFKLLREIATIKMHHRFGDNMPTLDEMAWAPFWIFNVYKKEMNDKIVISTFDMAPDVLERLKNGMLSD